MLSCCYRLPLLAGAYDPYYLHDHAACSHNYELAFLVHELLLLTGDSSSSWLEFMLTSC